VQQVVAHDRLLATADEWCSLVAALPAHAVAITKPLLRAAADASWHDSVTLEEFAEPTCFTTAAFADSVHTR
jgi:2-(1,2-epoxy-1,2-dihydrophenyl)acetyl-CoA isomerase